MSVNSNTKEIVTNIYSKLQSITEQIYKKLKTEKVLDVTPLVHLFSKILLNSFT